MSGDLPDRASQAFVFGSFMLIPARKLLLRDGTPVRIGGRALDILIALVERAGETVSKRDIIARVWPDVVVEEANLKVNLGALRRGLNDGGPGDPTYIATVTGRGYRFIAPVTRVLLAGNEITASPAEVQRHNLPTRTTRIIGRTDTIANIERDLEASRLVTIVGAGGIGKTTVALAVAEKSVNSLQDGVWLVDLAPLKDPSLTANAIASAVGLITHSADTLAGLCNFLRDRRMLLVLDSCEHVIESAATCAGAILTSAGGVRILVTSREQLRIQGERVRRLPELGLPPPSPAITAEAAMKFPSVQLFVDRAADHLESFRLSDADAPVVADICRKLDGLALAIELAATRIDAFGVMGILSQLDDRFRLKMRRRSGPARHKTLEATIDWSFELLPSSDQAVMRRLSVFAGAFSLETAVAVAADAELDRSIIVEAVANLVTKSLLKAEPREVEVEYRFLDTTRSYALEKLIASGELAMVRQRHAEYFLDVALRAEGEGDRLPRVDWLGRFGSTFDDVRSALNWSISDPENVELGVRLTTAAIPYWRQLSLIEECRAAIERALEVYDRFNGVEAAIKLKLVINLATVTTYLANDPARAVGLFETAVGLARKIGDADAECRALGALAQYKLLPGNDSVLDDLGAMRRAAARSGNRTAIWEEEQLRAQWEIRICDFQAARSRLERLSRQMREDAESGAPRFQIYQRLNVDVQLGAITWLTGSPGRALKIAKGVMKDALEADHGLTLIHCLAHGVVWTFIQCRDHAALKQGVDVFANAIYRHGMPDWIPVARCYRAATDAFSGDSYDPDSLLLAYDKLRTGMVQIGHGARFTMLAQAMLAIGQVEDSARVINHVMDQHSQPWGLCELLRIRAATEYAVGNHDKAEASLRASLAAADEIYCPAWKLRTAHDLAELLLEHGEHREARQILSPAFDVFTDGLDTGDLRDARDLLARMDAN